MLEDNTIMPPKKFYKWLYYVIFNVYGTETNMKNMDS